MTEPLSSNCLAQTYFKMASLSRAQAIEKWVQSLNLRQAASAGCMNKRTSVETSSNMWNMLPQALDYLLSCGLGVIIERRPNHSFEWKIHSQMPAWTNNMSYIDVNISWENSNDMTELQKQILIAQEWTDWFLRHEELSVLSMWYELMLTKQLPLSIWNLIASFLRQNPTIESDKPAEIQSRKRKLYQDRDILIERQIKRICNNLHKIK